MHHFWGGVGVFVLKVQILKCLGLGVQEFEALCVWGLGFNAYSRKVEGR